MKNPRHILTATFLLLASSLLLPSANAADDWLFTPEEAVAYQMTVSDLADFDPSWKRRDMLLGPDIQVLSPTVRKGSKNEERLETGEDTKLSVLFAKLTPDSPEVDMDTFKVMMRKGADWLEITQRLLPYLQKQENRLEAKHLRIPPGTYAIAFKIKDVKRNASEKGLLLVVQN